MIISIDVLDKEAFIAKYAATMPRGMCAVQQFDKYKETGELIVDITTEDGGYFYSLARLERALRLR